MIRSLIQAFNNHMEEYFNPSWLNCLDELMVSFLNEHCPNWVCIKRKPHPFGNEYHTIVCCLSKIIFRMELVETEKDRPKEGPYTKPEFKDKMTKTTALCVCMTKSIWGTKRVCLLDSGFGYMSTLPELEKKAVYGTTVFKQKGNHWPKGSNAKNVLRHMQGKQVGYQAVRQGSNPDYPQTNLWLASMADSKHTSVMANMWLTTLPKAKCKRRVGGNLIEIDYSEYMHYYYFGRHAVDNNNNNRQGRLSFEETFTPDRWELQHLGWIIALVQINSLLAYNIFNRKPLHQDYATKAKFTRELGQDLIHTEDNHQVEDDVTGDSLPLTQGPKTLPHGAQFNYLNDPCPFPGH